MEIDTGHSAGKPSSHKETLRFQFQPELLTGAYVLPKEAKSEVKRQTKLLRKDVKSFVSRARSISSFFPTLLQGSQSEREEIRAIAEELVAKPGSLINFYSSLKPPLGERALPPADRVNENWALYRWLQVQFLFGIDLHVRYQGQIPSTFTPGIYERLEHDVLDAQMLMLGCLEGAFATKEKKLQRWWRLLCPGGTLYE
ncbi:MAG: hypothetical protein Tsb007_28000 [Rhizobacter sp.]